MGFFRVNCHGRQAEGKAGLVHDFRRDSKAIVTAWCSEISAADLELIREVANPELGVLYPEDKT